VQPNGSIVDTTVYRDVQYGAAVDAVPLADGLAVLVARQKYDETGVDPTALTLYRTGPAGTRRDILFHPDSAFAAENPLHRTADGGFLLVLARTDADDEDLLKLNRSGGVEWTYRMPDVQFVSDAAQAPNGDVLVVGPQTSRQFDLARLRPDGTTEWQTTYGSNRSDAPLRDLRAVVSAGDGATVLGTREQSDDDDPRTASVVLTRFDSTGAFAAENAYATGAVSASALTVLPNDQLALSYAESYGAASDAGKLRSFLLRLDGSNATEERWRVGPRRGTTRATALVPLSDRRLAAVASTGPASIGGFGGDDFDVLVSIYQAE
jgi:hypothetical protein